MKSPRLACVALGVALALPALATPFTLDDFFQIAALEGAAPVPIRWWELYTFSPADAGRREALVAGGVLPWWTSPHLRLAFFRPLSSALVVLDHAVFGRHAALWHLHTLAWWAGVLLAAALLFRRALPAGAGVLALALFAIDDAHWMPIGWAAARNGLVALLPALLGLVAHVRWREQGWRAGALLGPGGLAVGLAGGEGALGVLGYLVAFEALGRPRDRWPRRLAALAPYGALLLAYAAVRAATGAGVSGSGTYFDPVADPAGFARAAAGRVPALAGGLLLGVPAELWEAVPRARVAMVALGLGALALAAAWLRAALGRLPEDQARATRWLGAGALLALVPGAGAMLGERVLLPASLGSAAVIAVLLRDGLQRWRQARGGGLRARSLPGLALLVLAVPNLVLAGPLLVGKLLLWKQFADRTREGVCEAPLDRGSAQRVLVVWAQDPTLAVFGGAARWFHCPGGTTSWSLLSIAPQPQTLTRSAPDELTLISEETPLLGGPWELLFRAPGQPMQPGQSFTQESGLRITVEAARNGRPTRLRVRVPPDLRLLVGRDQKLAALPALSVGESLPLGGND
jgi:hypothetical protein